MDPTEAAASRQIVKGEARSASLSWKPRDGNSQYARRWHDYGATRVWRTMRLFTRDWKRGNAVMSRSPPAWPARPPLGTWEDFSVSSRVIDVVVKEKKYFGLGVAAYRNHISHDNGGRARAFHSLDSDEAAALGDAPLRPRSETVIESPTEALQELREVFQLLEGDSLKLAGEKLAAVSKRFINAPKLGAYSQWTGSARERSPSPKCQAASKQVQRDGRAELEDELLRLRRRLSEDILGNMTGTYIWPRRDARYRRRRKDLLLLAGNQMDLSLQTYSGEAALRRLGKWLKLYPKWLLGLIADGKGIIPRESIPPRTMNHIIWRA
ncbi:hypothetical protein B0T24DRAFT_598141 [Lasiosphaeria ovina]|uniref:Uncharacterized protein n=1 Tax=Lasiosphaeria ovina TaxID=92902 RepID=A0AAE0JV28_9PEZI|nr:hypothetical protein B0T24DRAFT_598141 [Lasiosphaeria ovina]